jgi:hypothetical protein
MGVGVGEEISADFDDGRALTLPASPETFIISLSSFSSILK